jgi:hypothetical protein
MMSFRKKLNKQVEKTEITTEKKEVKENTNEVIEDNIFALEEARYLLSLIANSDFSGKDVQIVYNIALKLQNFIKNEIKE